MLAAVGGWIGAAAARAAATIGRDEEAVVRLAAFDELDLYADQVRLYSA